MLIANDDLSLPGESFIESLTSGEGDAGSIALEADNITIEGFRSGDVPLFASIRTIALAQSFDVGVIEPIGNAGPITIHANDNLVLNVASIDTSVAGGDADAGDIEIRATNLIMIDSDIQSIAFDSFVCSSLPCEGFSEVVLPTGNSGNINIMAQNVDVGSGSFIGTLTQGTGAAGRVVIIAEDAAFSFGEVNSSSRFSQLFVPDGEVLGPAGDVSVIADTLVLEGSSIRTDATTAEGGRITVQSDDLIDLFRANIISDGVQPGEDDSIITLSAPLIAVNDSRVTSLTGDGAPLLGSGEARLLGDSTVISADSEVAASSTVEITGQEADVGSQLVTLGGVFLDTAPLSARCGARRDIGASSFTGVGRGGLPASPDGPLASAYIVKEARVADLQAAKFRPAIAGAPEDVRLAGFGAPCAPLD